MPARPSPHRSRPSRPGHGRPQGAGAYKPRATQLLRLTPRHVAAVGLVAAATGAFTGVAQAGTYKAWLCTTPAGQPTTTDGWRPVADSTGGHVKYANTCASQGGNLSANFFGDGVLLGNREVRYTYEAPATTTVEVIRVNRSYGVTSNNRAADSYGQAGVMVSGPAGALEAVFSPSQFAPDSFQSDAGDRQYELHARSFSFAVGCYGDGQCGNSSFGRASMALGSMQLDLTDSSSPKVSDVDGTILAQGGRSGIETLTFLASDQGSGIWQGAATLDGVPVAPRRVLNDNAGKCNELDLTPNYDREFRSASPCPEALSSKLTIDTTKVSDGEHTLNAEIWDASGNALTFITRKVTVANKPSSPPTGSSPTPTPTPTSPPTPTPTSPPTPTPTPTSPPTPTPTSPPIQGPGEAVSPGVPGAPNGTGGDPATGRIIGRKAPAAAARFGSKLVLGGKVVDAAGVPIAGAIIDVYETLDLLAAPKSKVDSVMSNAAGEFSYAVTTHSSRTIEFAFAAKQASIAYRDRFSTKAVIRAAISFKAPARGRAGQAVTFTGVLTVDPLPTAGARVMIESKVGSRWITAAVVRTRAGGAFRWTHRFRTHGSYRMRARVLGAIDLAAKPGASQTRSLRIR